MREDEALEDSIEPPPAVWPGERASRRKSTLGLITGNEGLHTIKGPKYGGITTSEEEDVEHNEQSTLSRKSSSRKARWQSVRQRTKERREGTELQMKNVNILAKKLQENQKTQMKKSRIRSSTFPVAGENSPKTTKRNLSCGDTVQVGNGLELAGAIPKAKQEDIAKRYQDTRF